MTLYRQNQVSVVIIWLSHVILACALPLVVYESLSNHRHRQGTSEPILRLPLPSNSMLIKRHKRTFLKGLGLLLVRVKMKTARLRVVKRKKRVPSMMLLRLIMS